MGSRPQPSRRHVAPRIGCAVPVMRILAPLALCCVLLGCVDTPEVITGPGGTSDRLSGLGFFVGDLAAQHPAPGVVAYDVNVSLYADGAHKHRFVYVPAGQTIHAREGRWDVPVGTVFIKTFYVPNDARDPTLGERLIETRFLVRTTDGYQAATYLWNDAQTDAVASGGNVEVPAEFVDATGALVNRTFHVPGTSQCQSCHGGRALGWRSAQLDHPGAYPDGTTSQMAHLVAEGVVDAVPSASIPLVDPFGTAPLDERARSYLDANCGHCHSAETGSEAAGTHVDWDYESTVAASLPLCRPTFSINGRNHVIVPGRPDASEMLARMRATDPFARMPLGPSRVPDTEGMEVLSEWISAMSPAGCP